MAENQIEKEITNEVIESKETKAEKEEHKCSECEKQAEHQDQASKKYYCDDHWEELKVEEKEEEKEPEAKRTEEK